MLNKSIITLTTAMVLGCTSAAFAYEDPENRLGDKYPFLEQVYQPNSTSRYTGRYVTPRQVATQYTNEVPENKIGDRYSFLEQTYAPVAANRLVGRYSAPRPSANSGQYAYEAPENKIGDRYPLLERQVAYQSGSTRAVSSRTLRSGTVR